nr:hypothetical protein Iba_scaffold10328CG0010 [Ipomoea batatas]
MDGQGKPGPKRAQGPGVSPRPRADLDSAESASAEPVTWPGSAPGQVTGLGSARVRVSRRRLRSESLGVPSLQFLRVC